MQISTKDQRVLDRLSRKLAAALKSGQRRKTRSAIRFCLQSSTLQRLSYDLAFEEWKAKWHKQRKHRKKPNFAELEADMDLWKPCSEPVAVRTEFKNLDSGDMSCRFIFEFPLIHQARQVLLREVIKAMWPVADCQMMFSQGADKRGREAAISRVKQYYKQGFQYVAELDIKSCYPSFRMEGVAHLLCLPESVVCNLLNAHAHELVLSPRAMGGADYHTWFDHPDPMVPFAEFFNDCGDDWIAAQQGLIVGSKVSPFVAEKLLASVCKDLLACGGIRVVNYADNFLLLAKTPRGLGKAKRLLRGLLRDHPAGPLLVEETLPIENLPRSFEFLGYLLTPNEGVLVAEPTKTTLNKLNIKRREGYRVLNSKMPIEEKTKYFASLEREHKAVVRSYQHWEDGVAFHNDKMAGLRNALDRSSGTHLLRQTMCTDG